MLDKNEVFRKLTEIVPHLIITINEEMTLLKDCLRWLKKNFHKLDELFNLTNISWIGQIDQTFEIEPWKKPYHILGVDGSQIYPDRHQGINCFLLNIGFAEFSYAEQSRVALKSFSEIYFDNKLECELSTETINYLRTEQEFIKGFEYSKGLHNSITSDPFLFLFDGPLYFWYLNNKPAEIKNRFLSQYIASLNLFYTYKIPIIGFLSAPKNTEIINLLKVGLSKKIIDLDYNGPIDFNYSTDIDFFSLFLPLHSRTCLFSLCTPLSLHYPADVRPWFCYINLGDEIVRIEVPYWLTQDSCFDNYLRILIDQCKKGNGYPIALSEAHEQAVIKSFDRDFFYTALHRISSQHNHILPLSQKSIKKKMVAV